MNTNNDNSAAIVAYFWWIGLLIAFIMNHNKRDSFSTFHIRQSFGLSILFFIAGLITQYLNGLLGSIVFIVVFVLWVIGLLSSIKKEMKPIPFIGEKFQEWFKSI